MNVTKQQFSQRRSIRLPDYNYSEPGYYFITICTQDRKEMFGRIADGKMIMDDVGRMVGDWWKKIPERFDEVGLDVFQIMPNHVHGIIIIDDNHQTVGAGLVPAHHGKTVGNRATTRVAPTIGDIVG